MPISSLLELTELEESFLPTPLFPLHTKIPLVSPFLPLLTQKQGGVPPQKCRRADIFDFSLDISCFSCPERAAKGHLRVTSSLASGTDGAARGLALQGRAGLKASATWGNAERQRSDYLEAEVAKSSAGAGSLRWTD